jgi:predicted nucleic acid-binding Zn ribbon protein
MKKYNKIYDKCILCGKPTPKKRYSKYCSTECRIVYRRKYRQIWYQRNKERINQKVKIRRTEYPRQENVDLETIA